MNQAPTNKLSAHCFPMAIADYELYERLKPKPEEEETRALQRFKEESLKLDRYIDQCFDRLEQKLDRLLYTMVFLFLVFNLDKVIGFLQAWAGGWH